MPVLLVAVVAAVIFKHQLMSLMLMRLVVVVQALKIVWAERVQVQVHFQRQKVDLIKAVVMALLPLAQVHKLQVAKVEILVRQVNTAAARQVQRLH